MKIYFRPDESTLPSIQLYAQHRRLWQEHGESILRAFEKVTGESWQNGVRILVVGNWDSEKNGFNSSAGFKSRRGISLRYASFNPPDWRVLSNLVHELGHRFIDQHQAGSPHADNEAETLENHRQLFVFLVDVINRSFKAKLAQKIITEMEANYNDARKSESNPYLKAWQWSRQLTFKRRQEICWLMFAQKIAILPKK